jgi:hypothetical protein
MITYRIAAFCAALGLVPVVAQADNTWSDKEVNSLMLDAYICGSERMKMIMKKPVKPMIRQAEEFCADIKLKATYEPEKWRWMFVEEDSTQGDSGEAPPGAPDVILPPRRR